MPLFADNKYTRWYYNIIEAAQQEFFGRYPFDRYTEKHHIIPKCLGGQDEEANIVCLTGRQHFICHWLLTKMVFEKKHYWQMLNALSLMMWGHNNLQDRYKISSRLYEQLKAKHSQMLSDRLKGVKRKPFSDEWKAKLNTVLRASNKKRLKKISKKVEIDGIVYPSGHEAARQLDTSQAAVHYRLNSIGFPEYKYVKKINNKNKEELSHRIHN